jgi:hypothetical protein
MKPEDVDAAVRAWHERCVDLEARIEQLDEAVGLDPDSPLRGAVWALIGGYVGALDRAYAIGGWLSWWWEECQLGAHVGAWPGPPARTIETVDQLVAAILEDLATAGDGH